MRAVLIGLASHAYVAASRAFCRVCLCAAGESPASILHTLLRPVGQLFFHGFDQGRKRGLGIGGHVQVHFGVVALEILVIAFEK